jgi:hypothetical protein
MSGEPVLPPEFDGEVEMLREHMPHWPYGQSSFCKACGWSWLQAPLSSGRIVAGCRYRRAALQVLEDCGVLPDSVVIE